VSIDLQTDYKAVAEHLAARVREYANGVNKGPGNAGEPVALITLGFQFDQAGWVALVFDTRPDAKSDGHWQFHIRENRVDFGHWFDALEPMQEAEYGDGKAEPLTIILHDGDVKTLQNYDVEEVAGYIGAMLRQVLVDARDSGLLAQLPLAGKCLMGVEEHDGYYGWPHYKDRFKLGRVN
jgi:hypothetical protein